MKNISKDLKIIIVTYKSDTIIHKTLKNLKSFKVIVIENSSNYYFKKNIEKKYKNVKCFISGKNMGYGRAINFALKRVKSKYYLILNLAANCARNWPNHLPIRV